MNHVHNHHDDDDTMCRPLCIFAPIENLFLYIVKGQQSKGCLFGMMTILTTIFKIFSEMLRTSKIAAKFAAYTIQQPFCHRYVKKNLMCFGDLTSKWRFEIISMDTFF